MEQMEHPKNIPREMPHRSSAGPTTCPTPRWRTWHALGGRSAPDNNRPRERLSKEEAHGPPTDRKNRDEKAVGLGIQMLKETSGASEEQFTFKKGFQDLN